MRLIDLLTFGGFCLAGFSLGFAAGAQQTAQAAPQVMGTIATGDARVGGGLSVQGERAELVSNASVTAYGHAAAISLARGGQVLVCATSQFHLLHSGTGQSLLFGLDRGAFEIHGMSDAQDMILTPDLRFTIESPGRFDLGLRVTQDGDTCVDNAGAGAPVLMLNDAFSSASYRLLPGQHVLFEHASLGEVVDSERLPCGCPATPPPQAGVASSGAGRAGESAGGTAETQHPFPVAASEGLAPETLPANSAPAGQKHTQIAATLTYAQGQGPPPSTVPAAAPSASSVASAAAAGASGPAEPPAAPPGAHSIVHAIGHFFHKLFHPHGSQPSSVS